MSTEAEKSTIPRLSVFLISAVALSYEILLTRLFAIIQWHHFAYMIISLALLGYGTSGTFLTIFKSSLKRNYEKAYIINVVLFGISILFCFLIAQQISFNAEEIFWDFHQVIRLFYVYITLMLPFFFAANAICLVFMWRGQSIAGVYAVDLVGAGVGSLLCVFLLIVLFPNNTLVALSVIGSIAALVAWWELKIPHPKWLLIILPAVLVPLAIPADWIELSMSPYKGLMQLLRVNGTRVIETKSGPLGLVHVVESPDLPLRYVPGMGINAGNEPPEQLAVFVDGDSMSAITRNKGDLNVFAYLDQLTSALPYHLIQPRQVLILGSGTGSDVLQAEYQGTPLIDAVELNPQIVGLMIKEFSEYTGGIYRKKNIHLSIAEARGYVAGTSKNYDIINIALLDAFGSSSAGLYALSENYLYTVEALQDYIDHLDSNGYVALTSWVKNPPRDTLKLFVTAVDALREHGLENPEQRLVLIRGWQTSTLLIKNGLVSPQDVEQVVRFCKSRNFDVVYYPGIKMSEVNIYNILPQPIFYQAVTAILSGKRSEFLDQYKFNLQPSTDDKPYFFDFLKWKLLPEVVAMADKGGLPLLEWGYVILIATLLQAVIASVVLIVLPLLFGGVRTEQAKPPVGKFTIFTYFFAIGLAFLFIEIAFIQKFTLFLHHPVYSISITLAVFLIFAGIGSSLSPAIVEKLSLRKSVIMAVSAIFLIGLIYSQMLDEVFLQLLHWNMLLKIIVSIVLIAPLAFFMGMPFPIAISCLDKGAPGLVPWAWAVNGCASVISAVLAMLLAVQYGFEFVVLAALALYLVAVVAFARLQKLNSVN